MWHSIGEEVPLDRDVLLAVLNHDGLHALEFPCRFSEGCWIHAKTGRPIDIRPTHWRDWLDDAD